MKGDGRETALKLAAKALWEAETYIEWFGEHDKNHKSTGHAVPALKLIRRAIVAIKGYDHAG